MYASAPLVVKSISRYARRRSSVDSNPIASKRFLIVPLLSSAARMPLPGATSASATSSNWPVPMTSPPTSSTRSFCPFECCSFPFDGARWLRRDVVGHPVHAGDLVDDAGRDALEHVVRQPGPVGGHRGGRREGTDDDGIRVGAVVPHHATRPHDREDREALPDLPVQTRAL